MCYIQPDTGYFSVPQTSTVVQNLLKTKQLLQFILNQSHIHCSAACCIIVDDQMCINQHLKIVPDKCSISPCLCNVLKSTMPSWFGKLPSFDNKWVNGQQLSCRQGSQEVLRDELKHFLVLLFIRFVNNKKKTE